MTLSAQLVTEIKLFNPENKEFEIVRLFGHIQIIGVMAAGMSMWRLTMGRRSARSPPDLFPMASWIGTWWGGQL